MASRILTSGFWSPWSKRQRQGSQTYLGTLANRAEGLTNKLTILLRTGIVLAVLTISATASGDDEASFTCTNNGTLVRFAVGHEVPEQELPCTVERLEHPLGRYHMKWEILWRAENNASFCAKKMLELVEGLKSEGWKCLSTEAWRGRE